METSILNNTKEVLGLASDYTAFDLSIILHINAAFSTLWQLGVGPTDGFMIEDSTAKWADLGLPQDQMNLVRAYIYLKVRFSFDPPTTSFLLDAVKEQIRELEVRLNLMRELLQPPIVTTSTPQEPVW